MNNSCLNDCRKPCYSVLVSVAWQKLIHQSSCILHPRLRKNFLLLLILKGHLGEELLLLIVGASDRNA